MFIKLFLDYGADINFPHATWSPIMVAFREGYIDLIKLLMNYGTPDLSVIYQPDDLEYDYDDDGMFKLLSYAAMGGADSLQELLREYQRQGISPVADIQTALYELAFKDLRTLDLMLINGSDANQLDDNSYNVAMNYVKFGIEDFNVASRLIQMVDLDHQNVDDDTIAILAAKLSRIIKRNRENILFLELLEIIRENGADMSIRNYEGHTYKNCL